MNILILSIGAKNKIVKIFKESGYKVVATDCSELSAGLYSADAHYIVPRMKDPGYIGTLLEICGKESIDVILPLQEDELILISGERRRFEEKGIFVAISDINAIETCKDKYALYKLLEQNGVQAVPTYDCDTEMDRIEQQLQAPVIVKPRDGAGSVGVLKCDSMELCRVYAESSKESMIAQPCIQGDEFGVDTYIDFVSGEITDIFIKQKLRMRAGETEKSVSVHDKALEKLVRDAMKVLPFRGPIDMDVLRSEGQYYVLEINPRFGGGYPHAYSCGVDFPARIRNNVNGKVNAESVGQYEDGVTVLKYTETLTLQK